MVKAILIPGNGGGSPKDNWFPEVKTVLESNGVTVVAKEFPDNHLARSEYWLPFIEHEIGIDERTILIGHSSGAIAAMKIAEKNKILGSVLVGTYHTDLGLDDEKASGYFDSPWDWESIKANQKWTIIFASQDDPWIDIKEPRFIHEKLGCEYHEYQDQGHFGGDYHRESFPELSMFVINRLVKNNDISIKL